LYVFHDTTYSHYLEIPGNSLCMKCYETSLGNGLTVGHFQYGLMSFIVISISSNYAKISNRNIIQQNLPENGEKMCVVTHTAIRATTETKEQWKPR
jgi:hypothetical protein